MSAPRIKNRDQVEETLASICVEVTMVAGIVELAMNLRDHGHEAELPADAWRGVRNVLEHTRAKLDAVMEFEFGGNQREGAAS